MTAQLAGYDDILPRERILYTISIPQIHPELLYCKYADAGTPCSFCLVNLALLSGSHSQVKDQAIIKSAQSQLNSLACRTWASWKVTRQDTETPGPCYMLQAAQTSWKYLSSVLTEFSKTFLIHRSRQQWSAQTARMRSTRSWQFCAESALRIQRPTVNSLPNRFHQSHLNLETC